MFQNSEKFQITYDMLGNFVRKIRVTTFEKDASYLVFAKKVYVTFELQFLSVLHIEENL